MKRNKGFNVNLTSQHGYDMAEILFCVKKKYGDEYTWIGKIRYQKKSNKDEAFYGGHIRFLGDDVYELNYLNKIMNDIKKNVNNWKSSLEDTLDYITNNYNRYIHDEREYAIIKFNEVKNVEYNRYMLRDEKKNRCILSCIAKNEECAISEFKKQIGKFLQEGSTWYDLNLLADWLKNPKVELDTHNKAPKLKGIYEILGIEKSKKKEKVS
jgi:hypothetical protein